MIIRRLREDENRKADILQATAFNFSYNEEEQNDGPLREEAWGAFLDDGETLTSMMYPITYQSRYGNGYLPALGIGGVATFPQYRRCGGIRAIFEKLLSMAPERGWAMSYLYPFSYDYYRKFGYERVLRRKEMGFDCAMLAGVPRNSDAVLYTDPSQLPDLLDVYERFSAGMNLIFRRPADGGEYKRHYSPVPRKSMQYTYIWYDKSGKAQSYATCKIKDETLRVQELCYTSPEALLGILGFLRMYDGQVRRYRFTDLPEITPLEFLMGNYWEVDYEMDSFAMGRVLLPDVLLNAYDYPAENGAFTLAISDSLACSRGTFRVCYGGGSAQVQKLSDNPLCEADLTLEMPALSRIMLGSETLTARTASYLPGVIIRGEAGADAFLRAFQKRPGHIYTRF